MGAPRQKTLIFCTAYTHAAAGPFYTWNTRYRTWVDAVQSSTLHYDQMLLIDDGSATLPDWPDVVVLREGDDLQTNAAVVLYHFHDHLGRRAVSDFPGWVRSFFFAARFAQANGFEKIVHLEADAFLISRRVQRYVNDIREGWISFFCALFKRPESGIQIIAGKAVQIYASFARQPVDALAGAVIETTLPFDHVENGFIGDRYGEYLDRVPIQAEWCMQAVPKSHVPPDVFFWWLSHKPPHGGDGLRDVWKEPGARQAHTGLWYADFFTHFDRIMQPQCYFEIGTNSGQSLRSFSCDAVCVDPNFVLEQGVLGGRKRTFLYQGTSDDFFSGDDAPRVMPNGFDVAFLDGLHHAEVLLRDFINAEKYSRPGSVIFLHDCLPLNQRMAERDRRWDEAEAEATRDFWTGDVWKVMVALREFRPDLQILYLDCGPSGLAVCLNPDPRSARLSRHYENVLRRFEQLRLEEFGLPALWALFPTLDSRKLVTESGNMERLFKNPRRTAFATRCLPNAYCRAGGPMLVQYGP